MSTCACFLHAYADSNMLTHTTGMRRQAYVCTHMLVPKNLNLSFSASVSLFLSCNMPLF